MSSILYALLLASSPAATHPVASAASAANASPKAKQATPSKQNEKAADFDPAQLLAMFEKLFPAQPDPAPERLALSRITVNGLLPDGTYGRMMDDMMGGMVDRVLNLSGADFGAKGKDGKPATDQTLREQAIKDDPHFDERMRIMQRVIGEEMAKIAKVMEPRLREGLARSMARRFDEKQLADINAFLATDSGRAFGGQSMAMWVDSDVIRSMVSSFPEMLTAMPPAIARLEAETAHLPKPKANDKKAK